MRPLPVNAIRVFEAAGRLLSFKAAAAQLHVTPSAVSKQIRLLEDYLSVPLFERTGQRISLTRDGKIYLAAVSKGLATLDEATRSIVNRDSEGPLRLWCSQFFMRLWLVPHLASFRAIAPEQEVIITTGISTDEVPAECDIAIQLGKGEWPGYKAQRLLPMRLRPVCSPRYLNGRRPPRSFEDLAGHTILNNLARPDEWTIWSAAAGKQTLPKSATVIGVASSDATYRAALEGVGISLGRVGFIESDLERGSLVVASDIEADTGEGYYLLQSSKRRTPKRASKFRQWLLSELGTH